MISAASGARHGASSIGGRDVVRNAVDLAGMEQGEGAQQRNAPHRVFVVLRLGVVAQLQPLEEIPGRAALALADLPAPVFGLLVGRPARIAAAESQDGHAERQHVDAAIALTGRRVARHRRAAGLVGVPRPAPGRRAGFQRGDDPVGDFLVVVARRAVALAAAVLRSRCGACLFIGVSFPHGFLEHPSRPASRLTGARARPCARPQAGPLRRADGDAVGDFISFSLF